MQRSALLPALFALVVGAAAGYWFAPSAGSEDPHVLAGPALAGPGAGPGPGSTREDRPQLEGSNTGPARTGPAVTSAAPTGLSPHRVERAIRDVSAPAPVERVSGDGSIRGRVVDMSGAGVAGVTVIARASQRSAGLEDPDDLGGSPPPVLSLEEHLEEAAQDWARNRGADVRVVSGTTGDYELTGLDPRRRYNLSAYLEDRLVDAISDAYGVMDGNEVDFRVRALARLEVTVVDANGQPVAEAAVTVRRGNNSEAYAWTPGAPVLNLTPGRVSVRAYAGLLPGTYANANDMNAESASEYADLQIGPEGVESVTLQLQPRLGIRGTWNGEVGADHLVKLLELAPGASLDEKELARASRASDEDNGTFHFMDLPPGRYAVGATDWDGNHVLASAIVDVVDHIVDVQLLAGEQPEVEGMTLRAFGPSGRPLTDVYVRLVRQKEDGTNRYGIDAKENHDGSLTLPMKGRVADVMKAWNPGETWFLQCSHGEYGQIAVDLRPGQVEATAQFLEPSSIRARVEGYGASNVRGRLSVTAMFLGDDRLSEGGWNYGNRGRRLDADGTSVLHGVTPGRYRVALNLSTETWDTARVAVQEVDVGTGEALVTFQAPMVHDVQVVAPGMQPNGRMRLRAMGENLSGNWNVRLDDNLRGVFRTVPAGRYQLRDRSGQLGEMEVMVPTGEIVFQPRVKDALAVRINDITGSLHVAGVRPGDRIVGITGVDPMAKAMLEAINGPRTEGLELLVKRGDETVSITLPAKVENENLGARLTYTFRDA